MNSKKSIKDTIPKLDFEKLQESRLINVREEMDKVS